MTKRVRRSFCKHYRAMTEHKTCEAGVDYETFKGVPFDDRPCFCKDGVPSDKSKGLCSLAVYPTPEEVAAERAWLEKRFEDMGKARDAIVNHLRGPWKKGIGSSSGIIECPICKAYLKFRRSSYNGHIHAACSTEGCVRWME